MKNLVVSFKLIYLNIMIRHTILKRYKFYGESTAAVENIQYEINKLVKDKYQLASVFPDYIHALHNVITSRKPYVNRLLDSKNLRVSIHIVPSHFEIPLHIHPHRVNIIYVEQGELQIEQQTLSKSEGRFISRVKQSQSCAGLLNLRNAHHVKNLLAPCIFVSFNILRKTDTLPLLFRNLRNGFTPSIASGLMLLLSSTWGSNLIATEKKDISLSQISFSSKPHIASSYRVKRANKLRNGDGVKKDLYLASQLYFLEAKKGNAEAQYWLGIMHLEGLGITEDFDEALDWIALSSNQNYPPAQKMLNHLLTMEVEPEC